MVGVLKEAKKPAGTVDTPKFVLVEGVKCPISKSNATGLKGVKPRKGGY